MQKLTSNIFLTLCFSTLLAMLVAGCGLMSSSSSKSTGSEYQLKGVYLEGYDCGSQSQVAFHTGERGCKGVGVMSLTGGQYYNVDLNGVKIAYAMDGQNWTRLYVDAGNPVQREAAVEFARKYFASYGKIDSVRDARINIDGSKGNYTATINGGSVLNMTVQPVKGANESEPVKMENTANRLSPTLYQAKILNGTYSDGDRKLDFNGVNGFFNDDMNTKGSLGG